MPEPRRIRFADATGDQLLELLRREWIVTNGLGGYASGTIGGMVTRRYHGLLIAAEPAPLGRVIMLNHLEERLRLPDGSSVRIGGSADLGDSAIAEFRIEQQMPVWRFEKDGVIIEKRLLVIHRQNTVHLTYTLISDHQNVRLELQPAVHFRGHEQAVSAPLQKDYGIYISGNQFEVTAENWPTLRLVLSASEGDFVHGTQTHRNVEYWLEGARGYDQVGHLWSPGYFCIDLRPGENPTLIGSTESWKTIFALTPQEALAAEVERGKTLMARAHPTVQKGPAARLVLAADQFIIRPAGRVEDSVRAHASGDEIRTVIAGYHWFTDWGRDTMISLEGLALTTGRHDEARWILRTFAHYIRDGLIPNMFPEGANDGLYHTADATLWFFHALNRYVELTHDRTMLRAVLPKLLDIARHHIEGTRFGIKMDAEDALLRQGEEGYQLTWMDAKMGDWVVTPRRGKAVEINALWYNALRLLEEWLAEEQAEQAEEFRILADRAQISFNQRFWNEGLGHLFDIVDGEEGDDAACRPNQIFAISLDHPVLNPTHWEAVVETVRTKLLTPVGLRSLSQDHPDYKSKYDGDLRARDAAYHQGTVWGWLIGPYVDAWLRLHPGSKSEARVALQGLLEHLDYAGIGTLSEVFDAEEPFRARGCIAQAWSVAELLRCWVLTEP